MTPYTESCSQEIISKMKTFCSYFALLICLVLVPCVHLKRAFWRPTLPSASNDPYYKKFQNVPPAKVTAKNLMNNFLHIYPSTKRSPAIEDIVAVIDGSGSVGSCHFDKGRKALHYVMDVVENKEVKFAAVTFASSAIVNFKFIVYNLAAQKIKSIPYPDGGTNTQEGLAVAKKLFDDPSSGRRSHARKIVFLLTDGQSNVRKDLTIPNAQALKNSGVQIHVVAVGQDISGIDELVKLASFPPEYFLYRIKDYNSFFDIVKLVVKKVSPSKYKILSGQYNPTCR